MYAIPVRPIVDAPVRHLTLLVGLLLGLLAVTGGAPAHAQLTVTGSTPSPNVATADTGTTIVVTFNQPISSASVGPALISVEGSQTGPKAEEDGTVAVSSNQFTYEPATPFAFGEQVTVSIPESVSNDTQSTFLDTTETFQFRVQAGAGPSDFPVDSTITSSLGSAFDAVPADVDADEIMDVIAVGWTGGVVWFRNGGSGQTWTRNDVAFPTGSPDVVEAGDINGTGAVDAVVGMDTSIVWYENEIGTAEEDGDGFSNSTVITTQVDDVRALYIADVDGDQDADVVSASSTDDRIAWHENTNGDGSAWTMHNVTTSLAGAVSVEAVDLDGDNDPDLLASALFDADQAVWYENTDGQGTFGARQTLAAPGDQAADAHAADLDQDGDLDVLLMLAGSAKWYENTDGQGTFSLSESLTLSVSGGDDIHSADLDGDGDLDALTESGSDSTIAWYENTDGQGTFGSKRVVAKRDQPRSVHAADFDGDDDIDVLSASRYDNTVAWYPNTEVAPLATTRAVSSVSQNGFTAVADVNPGGDTTTVTFEYGEDVTFGTDSTVTATTNLTGDKPVTVSAPISGLDPATEYNYRVVATNNIGTGADLPLTITTDAQNVFYVDANASGAETGLTWTDAFSSLQDALGTVSNGDTLWVAAGTYYPDVGSAVTDGNADTSFVLPDGVAMYGGFVGGETALSQRDVTANPTILSGDIDQNDTDPNGDGLIQVSDISGPNSNHVVRGPGFGGRIDGFRITAGDASGTSAPAYFGGGLYAPTQTGDNPSIVVNRTTFVGNRADQAGGGMYVDNADVLMSNVRFLGNVTPNGEGGGLYVFGMTYGQVWMTNAVFTGNVASLEGGAIFNDGGLSLQNATLTQNSAQNGSGGGVYASSSNFYTQLLNTTIWGNNAASGGAQIYNGGSLDMSFVHLEGDTTAIGGSGFVGSANLIVDGDPLFLAPTGPDGTAGTPDDDVRLNWASPTIDVGPPNPFLPPDSTDIDNDRDRTEPVPIDIAGNPRLRGTNVDLGAYEGGAAPTGTNVVYADSANGADADSSGGSWTDPYRTVHAAIAAARNARVASAGVPFDEVWVAKGTYYPDDGPGIQSGDPSVAFPLADSVAIYGGFQNGDSFSMRDHDPATNGTVLNGDIGVPSDTSDNSTNVVIGGLRVAGGRVLGPARLSPAARLDGFAVMRGNATGGLRDLGGGIALLSGPSGEVSPTLRNLHVIGNYAGNGGGVAVAADSESIARPTIRHVRIQGNEAVLGGGLAIFADSASTASPRISETNILNNIAMGAPGVGGGAAISGRNGTAEPQLVSVRFFRNEAAFAGAVGISAENGGRAAPVIANTLFSGNTVTSDSGAVAMRIETSSTLEPRFVNTTWAGNTLASDSLSGLLDIRGAGTAANIEVANSILWGNAARSLVAGRPSTVRIDSSIVETGWSGSGSGTVTADPLYVDADGADNVAGTADDSLQVSPSSPALQHGGISLLPADRTDLDNDGDQSEPLPLDFARAPRVQQSSVDAGAYELDVSGLNPAISVTPSSFSERVAFGDSTTTALQIENTATGADAAPLQYQVYVTSGTATTIPAASPAQQSGSSTSAEASARPPSDWVALSRSSGTVDPGGSQSVGVEFRGDGTPPGTRDAIIRILSDDPSQDTTDVPVALTIDPPPVAISEPDTPPAPGSDVPLSIEIPASFSPTSGTLFYRTAGQRTVRDTAIDLSGLDAGAAGTVTATIPGGAVMKAGVAYFVELIGPLPDGSGTFGLNVPSTAPERTGFIPTQFNSIVASGPFQPNTYRMLSIPVDLGDRAAFDVLKDEYGSYDRTKWRLARWSAPDSSYEYGPSVDSLGPGRAAWLITNGGRQLEVSNGRSADASGPRTLQLHPAWNQIGNPFPFPVAWSDVQRPASVRPPFAYGPTGYRSDVQVLAPWEGVFVYNAADSTVTIQVPPVDTSGAATSRPPTRPKTEAQTSGYRLRAQASVFRKGTRLRDQATWLGFADAADEGFGPKDRAKPPGIGPRVRLDVTADNGPALSRSIKPPTADGAAWDLRVGLHLGERLSSSKKVSIALAETGRRPEGFKRYVIDRDRERRLPVTNGTVTVKLPKKDPTRRLRVIVGTEAFARTNSDGVPLAIEQTKLRANAPNPFRESTTIHYQLAEQQSVSIAIFDVLGRRVRTLVDEQKSAGVHRVDWAPDATGRALASGVYFCRMEAGSYTSTRKLVLVR